MKLKIYLIALFSFLIFQEGFSQINAGPKFGINNSYIFQDFSVDVDRGSRKYGFQAGAFAQAEFLFLFIQPEILYMSGNGQVEVRNDLNEVELVEYEFGRLDFPVFLGFRLGDAIRVGGGPVFSILQNESTNLPNNSNQEIKDSSVGYLAGIGFDIWQLVFDLRYEGSFDDIGNSFLGVDADQRISQLTLSVGLRLLPTKDKK